MEKSSALEAFEDYDLAVECVTHRPECIQRALAIRRVDEHVRVKVPVRRKRQVESGPLLPLGQPGPLRVPCPDDNLMTGSGEGLPSARLTGPVPRMAICMDTSWTADIPAGRRAPTEGCNG